MTKPFLVVSNLDNSQRSLDFSILDSITQHRLGSVSAFAFFHGYSLEDCRHALRNIVDMIFENQRVGKNGKLVVTHNFYMQFLYMLEQEGGLDHLLQHFSEFGGMYKKSCLDGELIEISGISKKVDEAKALLEFHGYLVLNYHNVPVSS